ncbi:hypothetical protein [Aquisphaera insulae]|uniref:hypothetical protein n=1 Tax=Aquisphaera insulae TaxID=2712864 RepID=UPI0013ED2D3F|nr:hypothetical protein [Aquisphaera insulae]
MNWRAQLEAYAVREDRPVLSVPEGVGLEFSDGNDVFWMLPGEATSSTWIAETEPNAAALLDEFRTIDRLRTTVLHVIRHDMAGRGMCVDRRWSGDWAVKSGAISSSINVGPTLTARCLGERDLGRILSACYEHTILGDPPDEDTIGRFLATGGPPVDERPWPDESAAADPPWTLRKVLLSFGLCEAARNPDALTLPEAILDALTPTGRLGRALLSVAERLPDVSASCEMSDCSIVLDFDDGEDGYRISRRSRELARLVRSLGIEGAAHQLADEYLRLNSARTLVLGAVGRAASRRGWSVQRLRPFFLAPGISATWHLGRVRRDVSFRVGRELTDALRAESPDRAIRSLLASQPAFAAECVAALGEEGPPPALPERELAPALPSRQPTLRTLDRPTIRAMDDFADRTLAAYLRDENALDDYRRPDRFDASRDTWATRADWVHLAERSLADEWPNPAALVVLVDAGDPRAMERARELLRRIEPDSEMGEAVVELVWRLRHDLPDVARRWFAAQAFESVPFAAVRARLGDPVARRFLRTNEGFEIDDENTWTERANPESLGERPDAASRARIRPRLVEWARTTWKWSPAETDELRKACWLGLDEVADALDENPYLGNGLLCGDRRHAMFDEPGILLCADLLLVWSRLRPTRLLARIAATAQSGEVVSEAEALARETAESKPACRKQLDSTLRIYQRWWQDLQVPLAIAWRRCRSALDLEDEAWAVRP